MAGKYQLWAFTQAGAQAAVLENAYNISQEKAANAAGSLTFTLPADDPKAAFITTAYEIKVRNLVKGRFEGLYVLQDVTERWDGAGNVIEASYSGVIIQLVDEENISYDTGATPLTPTAIVTALLALQERTPAITVGTIQPTTTFCVAVENVNLLKALQECVSYLGGYIEVDEDRHLNWWNEPAGSPTREIRYQKNMKGVTRKRDFTGITNKLYAYGYGETEAQVTLLDAGEANEYIEDATSQTAHGVHPRRITDKRITHPSTLLRWAQKVLAAYKDPVYSYTVDAVNLAVHPDHTFDLENLEVGQIVRVVNSDLIDPLTGVGLNVNVKIVKVTTNLSRPEEISLELANATKSLSDLIAASADTASIVNNIAVQIGAGQVSVMGTFTVDGWRATGKTTIDGGNIEANTITADAIKTSTLNAKTITLGTTGGDSIIKSGNFSTGSAGFQIKGDGSAEFNNVTVRGTLKACTLDTGNTMTVKGTIQTDGYVHESAGWCLKGNGDADFRFVEITGDLNAVNISCALLDSDTYLDAGTYVAAGSYVECGTVFKFAHNTSSGSAPIKSLYTPDGLTLYYKDGDGTSHALF